MCPPLPPIWVSVSQCSECGSRRSTLATACYKSKYPDDSGSGSPDVTRLWHSSVTHITCAPWPRAQGKVVASEGIVKSAEKWYTFILSLVLLEIVQWQCNRIFPVNNINSNFCVGKCFRKYTDDLYKIPDLRSVTHCLPFIHKQATSNNGIPSLTAGYNQEMSIAFYFVTKVKYDHMVSVVKCVE